MATKKAVSTHDAHPTKAMLEATQALAELRVKVLLQAEALAHWRRLADASGGIHQRAEQKWLDFLHEVVDASINVLILMVRCALAAQGVRLGKLPAQKGAASINRRGKRTVGAQLNLLISAVDQVAAGGKARQVKRGGQANANPEFRIRARDGAATAVDLASLVMAASNNSVTEWLPQAAAELHASLMGPKSVDAEDLAGTIVVLAAMELLHVKARSHRAKERHAAKPPISAAAMQRAQRQLDAAIDTLNAMESLGASAPDR